jgi:hypothetical protein
MSGWSWNLLAHDCRKRSYRLGKPKETARAAESFIIVNYSLTMNFHASSGFGASSNYAPAIAAVIRLRRPERALGVH